MVTQAAGASAEPFMAGAAGRVRRGARLEGILRALGLVLVLAGGVALSRVPAELRAEMLAMKAPGQRLQSLAAGDPPWQSPWSVRGRTLEMIACLDALAGPLAALFPARAARAAAEGCARRAEGILAGWPGFAPAWLVRAAVAPAADLDGRSRALVAARALAPRSAWQAAWRLDLATAAPAGAVPALAAEVRADARLLAEAGVWQPALARALARSYLAHPDWREVLGAGIAEAPPKARRGVLAALRGAAGARPAGFGGGHGP